MRATGSGAGCGNNWPLCNGAVVPRGPRLETVIEFTHRVTSGLSVLVVAALLIWAVRIFPRGHRARTAAWLTLIFLVVEAGLGAGLVLFHFVGQNASIARAVYLSAHLVNTQLLLACLTGTAWFARHKWAPAYVPRLLAIALGVALVVSVSGAVVALGDTLFPAASLAAGIRQEFSETAPVLLKLRLLHPAVAIAGGIFVLWSAVSAIRWRRAAHAFGWAVAGLAIAQLVAGAVNVALQAPVWMQIFHLFLADALWIALVLTCFESARDR